MHQSQLSYVNQSQMMAQSQIAESPQQVLHSTHMEILHKNQTLKEPCELPFIHLSEEDEKYIFDLGVQLKFGDFRTVLNAC